MNAEAATLATMADMRYRRLGNSGLAVSVVGIGCNNFGSKLDAAQTQIVVDTAIDEGVTLFDSADTYGNPQGRSEEFLGAALKANGRRDDVVLATKFGSPMNGANGPDFDARGSRRYIFRAVESSLRRLQTDRIDLYQIHRPDPNTPIEETLSALDDLVRDGKVRYIGSSNFSGWQIADAAWTASTSHLTAFISAQNHYSLVDRTVETDVIPACERFGVGMLPFFPLASGLLTGKYQRGAPMPEGARLSSPRFGRFLTDERWERKETLERYAAERSVSLLEVAIGGLAAQPAVASVIAGATTAEQVRANVAAGVWTPSESDLAALKGL
jgi:aryl-alcohol dehydrogenase-like predicted oxidoreductase